MSQTLSFSTVDVFSKKAFRGNQLAIIHVPKELTLGQDSKQTIAREFNFSESVFLHDAVSGSGSAEMQLDIFTPTEELPFAGHPTIGTLAYICKRFSPPLKKVTLITKAGPIPGRYDAGSEMAKADIPHNVHVHTHLVSRDVIMASQPNVTFQETRGLEPPQMPLVSIVKGMSFLLVQLSKEIEKLDGNSQKIAKDAVKLDDGWAPSFVGVYYFTLDGTRGSHFQIRARMLEENIGEDAATGSAASSLAVYLALQDGNDDEIYEFDIEQGLEMGRASYINVRVELAAGGREVKRVVLGGSAVLVTEGKLYMPKI